MAAPWRIFWLFVLAGHALAGGAWWWLAPGGFPLSHSRFWTNSVAPVVLLLWVSLALWAAQRERAGLLRCSLVAFPTAWIGAAASARIVFATTFARVAALPLGWGLVMAVAFAATFRGRSTGPQWPSWLAGVAGVFVGAALPVMATPPEPRTHPSGVADQAELGELDAVSGGIGEGVFVSLGDASTTIRRKPLTMTVQPVLRFLERSPDGAPTVFLAARIREGRGLSLVAAKAFEHGLDLRYRADYDASLRVEAGAEGWVRMDSSATLPKTIWSHLNSYCDVDVSGHQRLSLGFSPCPETHVDVRPMDYPFGRPLRFAFLDEAGTFRVVEATSGEKGPFRELASGPLARGEPLAITFYDADKAVARLVLEDWSAQIGRQLSPTAGWGAAVNPIEFCLSGDEAESSASIYITLAATSVGRGWDCVGHRAGTYRNRLRVEFSPDGS